MALLQPGDAEGLHPRRSRLGLRGYASLLAIIVSLLGCRGGEPEPVAFSGSTMGTTYTVKLAALPRGISVDDVKARTDRTLERINALMSTYRADSEISRFNAATVVTWQAVSAQTQAVVAAALEISRLTGGAFDVTVGPLVDLWGFGPRGALRTPPSAADIAAVRGRVGYRRLSVRERPPSLRKAQADVAVDLSAIAKGYAVDEVARLLAELGCRDFLVEIGGELRARGRRPGGEPWRVAVERPVSGASAVQRLIELADAAIATSGDYRNFVEIEGRRYSHTIDPAAGAPVTHTLASVSVVHESAMYADALATALMVMGPQRGHAFAERHGLAALLLERTPEGFRELATTAMARLLADQ